MPLELCSSGLDNDPRCVHCVQYNTCVNLQEKVKTPLKESHKTALYNKHQHNYFILVLLSRRILQSARCNVFRQSAPPSG